MNIKHKLVINNIEIQEGDIVKVKYATLIRETKHLIIPTGEEECVGRVCKIKEDEIIIDCSRCYISDIVEISLAKDGICIRDISKVEEVVEGL